MWMNLFPLAPNNDATWLREKENTHVQVIIGKEKNIKQTVAEKRDVELHCI